MVTSYDSGDRCFAVDSMRKMLRVIVSMQYMQQRRDVSGNA